MDIFLGLALSAHLGLIHEYNSFHPSIRAEFDNTIVAGAYYNSEENVSLYVAKNFKNANGYFLDLGVVSGYSVEHAPVIPFFRVGKEFTENYIVFAAPGVEVLDTETKIGVVLGLEYKLKLK